MGKNKGLSRGWFEKIASPEVVAEFDRRHEITIAVTSKCEHKWDGPDIPIDNGSSISCSKCGILAIDEDARG